MAKAVEFGQDYTSGEMWDYDWSFTPSKNKAPAGMLWHIIAFTNTKQWHGKGGVGVPKVYTKLNTNDLVNYASRVTAQGGTLELSFEFDYAGNFKASNVEQFKAIKENWSFHEAERKAKPGSLRACKKVSEAQCERC